MTNGQAQNKLGQLFVDIGVGGLGQTLKALNSVSATFLLTKNAAVQAVKPFVDMGVQAANSAVGIGKMATALGTTAINAQKLSYYLKQYKSEGLEGDIAKIQKMYADYEQRVGGIPLQYAYALRRIGLDWQDYNGGFEDTLKLIQDIKNSEKFKSFSDTEQLSILGQLGLSGQWKYLFEKADFDLNQVLAVTDETIQKQIEASEAMEHLKNSIDQLRQKVVEKILDSGALTKFERVVDKLDYYLEKPQEFKKDVKTKTKEAAVQAFDFASMVSPLGPTLLGKKAVESGMFANKGGDVRDILPGNIFRSNNKIILNTQVYNKGNENNQFELLEVINDDPSLNAIEQNNAINAYGKQ